MSLETTMKCLSVFANLKKLKARSKKNRVQGATKLYYAKANVSGKKQL